MFKKNDENTPPYLTGFRNALYHGAGFSRSDLKKPLIGVVNSWGEISPATREMNKLTRLVKEGISSAGATPVEFAVSGLCDGTCAGTTKASNYNMAWRDITAAYIEAVSMANMFDGLAFLSVCDEVVPAHLLAAARLNLPSIMISGGTMATAAIDKDHYWAGDVARAYAALLEGKLTREEYECIVENCCPGSGACGVMGTGNTMQVFAEAIGFTMPGSSILPGSSPELERQAYLSGRRVAELVFSRVCPFEIFTPDALENALKVVIASGGSTNVVFHALALARESRLSLKLDDFDRLSRKTPLICDVKPGGYASVLDLNSAGGVPAVMKELSGLLNLKISGVSGKSLEEIILTAYNKNPNIIRSVNNPLSSEGGIVVLRGNLAPFGAVFKTSASERQVFSGPAIVFESESDAAEAIITDRVKEGDVMVIRGLGPKGGPGLPCLYASLWLLESKGLNSKVALVTDGRLSGTIRGIAVPHVSPEAVEGGPIGVVHNGDTISIDIPAREVNLEVDEDELKKRLDEYKPLKPVREHGFMSIYVRHVTPTHLGAYLDL